MKSGRGRQECPILAKLPFYLSSELHKLATERKNNGDFTPLLFRGHVARYTVCIYSFARFMWTPVWNSSNSNG